MLSRCVVLGAAATILCAASAFAQTVTFSPTTYPYNLWNVQAWSNGTVRADLNGDGREDFVTTNNDQFDMNCTGSFTVVLSTGDGQYAAPVCYTLPSGNAALFAAGDFYNDGVLSLAVVNDQGTLFIYGNNGTGVLVINNSNSFELEGLPVGLVTADVNHDGIVDLIYDLPSSSGGALFTLLGKGGGYFNTPAIGTAFTMSNAPAWELYVGDFDNDSNTDIMVEGAAQVEDEILYGNGKGGFTAGPIVGGTAPKYIAYANFDIDNDGTMDLIGAPFTGNPEGANTYYDTLDIEWGHSDRALTSQTVSLKNCTASGAPPIVADFNGDGNNDILVVEASDCKGDGPYTLNVMLGNGSGTFQPEQVVYSSNDWIAEWHVMRASHSSKPDVALWQAQLVGGNEIASQQEVVLVNTSSGGFPSCTAPNFSATGINICSPTSTTGATSPVTFSLGGSNQSAGRDMELRIDGVKVDESLKETYSHYSFLNATEVLSAGQHTVTAYSVGWDYTLKSNTFDLNVGNSTCALPSSPGLNICSPINGASVASPVLVQASGTVSGSILRMEVWVDGVKEYSTFGSDTLQTSLNIAPGMHMFTYYVVNTAGDLWSQSTYAAAKYQYQVSLLVAGAQNVINGQVSVDSSGSVTVQLNGVTASTTFAVQFCPNGLFGASNPACFNVGSVSSNSSGNATTTMAFPKAGSWGGDFELVSNGTTVYQTTYMPGVNAQVYLSTLQPYSTLNQQGVIADSPQNLLSGGSVTLSNGYFQFQLTGALPNAIYSVGECPLIAGSDCYTLDNTRGGTSDFTTNDSGDVTFSVLNDGVFGDILTAGSTGSASYFEGGFLIP